MGELNAVSVANQVHAEILLQHGCLEGTIRLLYGRVLPRGPLYQGLYIDDLFTLMAVPRHLAAAAWGADRDLVFASHRAYEAAGVARAPEKSYGFGAAPKKGEDPKACLKFEVIGTEILGGRGKAATKLMKRVELFQLTVLLAGEPVITKNLARRGVSLYTHPLVHRRELMCVWGKPIAGYIAYRTTKV